MSSSPIISSVGHPKPFFALLMCRALLVFFCFFGIGLFGTTHAFQNEAPKTDEEKIRVELGELRERVVNAYEDRDLESRRRRRWRERFQWMVGLAIVCLMLEPLVSERRRTGAARDV